MALVAMIEPGLFLTTPAVPMRQAMPAARDSAVTGGPDSLLAVASDAPAVPSPDSTDLQTANGVKSPALPPPSADSSSSISVPVNVVLKRAVHDKEPNNALSSEEKRTMAKIFDAMDPASAARILYNMDDGAVNAILSQMKPRQSAKVLAELDPKQAARILKGVSQ